MKGSVVDCVQRRRDAFNTSNGGRLRAGSLFFVGQTHEKAGRKLSPRNPADIFTVYVAVAGLRPSRSYSVLARPFISMHELTGSLTHRPL